MKKLSLKKLNLNAGDLLQREQLKAVFGGYETYSCKLTTYGGSMGTQHWTVPGLSSDPQEQTNAAQSACGQLLSGGYASRCFYDCEYDGFGY